MRVYSPNHHLTSRTRIELIHHSPSNREGTINIISKHSYHHFNQCPPNSITDLPQSPIVGCNQTESSSILTQAITYPFNPNMANIQGKKTSTLCSTPGNVLQKQVVFTNSQHPSSHFDPLPQGPTYNRLQNSVQRLRDILILDQRVQQNQNQTYFQLGAWDGGSTGILMKPPPHHSYLTALMIKLPLQVQKIIPCCSQPQSQHSIP